MAAARRARTGTRLSTAELGVSFTRRLPAVLSKASACGNGRTEPRRRPGSRWRAAHLRVLRSTGDADEVEDHLDRATCSLSAPLVLPRRAADPCSTYRQNRTLMYPSCLLISLPMKAV